MALFDQEIVRPAIYRFVVPRNSSSLARWYPTGYELEFVTKWGWVELHDVGSVSGIPGGNSCAIVLEYADFKMRNSQYAGVCFVEQTRINCYPFWQPICRPNCDPTDPRRFFWNKKDLESNLESNDDIFGKVLFVPSGWANGVLDEIRRRRKAGEKVLPDLGF